MVLLYVLFLGNQQKTEQNCKTFSIGFYNVENLFDTIDDKHKNDNDFLPESKNNWNTDKYIRKLENLSKVISKLNKENFPDILGLAEVENLNVLQDLVKQNALKKANYSIIHFESPDLRGIDVALLYRKSGFTVVYSTNIAITDVQNPNFKTRDILYVKGFTKSKDTLHVFVNHWPSRIGGTEETEIKRELCAKVVKAKVDSIMGIHKKAKIVIIGDFNDEPNDAAFVQVLKSKNDFNELNSDNLYNLSHSFYASNSGTYYYAKEKKWNILDNFIVSGQLLTEQKSDKLKTKVDNLLIFSPDWICFKDKQGKMIPNKTFTGKYTAGFSDHFPIVTSFEYDCR